MRTKSQTKMRLVLKIRRLKKKTLLNLISRPMEKGIQRQSLTLIKLIRLQEGKAITRMGKMMKQIQLRISLKLVKGKMVRLKMEVRSTRAKARSIP